jgi:hypothetical protein
MSCANSTITNLPLSDPQCSTTCCLAYAAGRTASQAMMPNNAAYAYGKYTVWFFAAGLFVFTVPHVVGLVAKWRASRSPAAPIQSDVPSSPTSMQKLRARGRMLQYAQFPYKISGPLHLPSVATVLVMVFMTLFMLIASVALAPLIREKAGFGQSPLAMRAGMIALGITPFLVGLAGKVNIITMITGSSHEKLNVLHRYLGHATFILSVIHTVPFIAQPWQEGGIAAFQAKFYKGSYITGSHEVSGHRADLRCPSSIYSPFTS